MLEVSEMQAWYYCSYRLASDIEITAHKALGQYATSDSKPGHRCALQ